MIVDVSNEIYTSLETALNPIVILTSYPQTGATFPCVMFEEKNNTTHRDTVDTSGEKHNDITLEINIFTNSQDKVSESKSIRKLVDDVMGGQYRLPRTFADTTPNFMDTSVYRYTLRYSFLIDSNKTIYRR